MHVEWFGQSAFASGGSGVFIDPFGDLSALDEPGSQFDYPPIDGVRRSWCWSPTSTRPQRRRGDRRRARVLRSTAGDCSPIGEVLAVASEHDARAGTERGPNTIFVFALDGMRVCHFGDFGQSAARGAGRGDRQGGPVIMPVGGGPTIGAEEAARSSSASAAVGRADALPHAAHRLPRHRRGVPRPPRARRAPDDARVRDRELPLRTRPPASSCPRGALRRSGARRRVGQGWCGDQARRER